MKKSILSIVLAVVLLGGAGVGGYFLGVEDGKAQAADTRQQVVPEQLGGSDVAEMWRSLQGQGQGQAQGQLRFPQGQADTGTLPSIAGRGGTIGTIKSIEGNTLVISTGDRDVKVVVSDDTRITMTTEGTVGDLEVGERITVAGQTEGDTVTATQIQLVAVIP
jgi:hypothetical protein